LEREEISMSFETAEILKRRAESFLKNPEGSAEGFWESS